VTLWVSNQASYMDKVTLFHVFNRQVEVRTIGGTLRGQLWVEVHVLAGAVACSAPEQGYGQAVKVCMTRKNTLPPSP